MILFFRGKVTKLVTVVFAENVYAGHAAARHSIPDEVELLGHSDADFGMGNWFDSSPEFEAFVRKYSTSNEAAKKV